jgi:hypothetical protein
MGYWENTAYINSSATDEVCEAITELFMLEEMELIPAPKERIRQVYEPMQYEKSNKNNIWGVAVFPGKNNWAVVKTAPLELFGEKNLKTGQFRLSELCKKLSCEGFIYNVYDSGPELLLEVLASGEYGLSGWSYDGSNYYNGDKLDIAKYEIIFRLLNYQPIIEGISSSDEKAMVLANAFGGENKKYCDNITSVDLLICHKTLRADGGQMLYYEYQGNDRFVPPSSTWEEYRL